MKEKNEAKKDIDIFLPEPVEIETREGKIRLPKVTWAMDIECIRILSELVREVHELAATDFSRLTPEDVLQIISSFFSRAPEKVTLLASVLLQKDTSWVEKNMTLESMMDLLVPFFFVRGKRLVDRWRKLKAKYLKEK